MREIAARLDLKMRAWKSRSAAFRVGTPKKWSSASGCCETPAAAAGRPNQRRGRGHQERNFINCSQRYAREARRSSSTAATTKNWSACATGCWLCRRDYPPGAGRRIIDKSEFDRGQHGRFEWEHPNEPIDAVQYLTSADILYLWRSIYCAGDRLVNLFFKLDLRAQTRSTTICGYFCPRFCFRRAGDRHPGRRIDISGRRYRLDCQRPPGDTSWPGRRSKSDY